MITEHTDTKYDLNLIHFEFRSIAQQNLHLNKNKTHRLFDIRLDDPEWKNTYISKISKEIHNFYNYNRILFRVLEPLTSYSWHNDKFDNVFHIPVISFPGNFFIFADEHHPLTANGHGYMIEGTTNYHTFVNSSKEPRLHLIYELHT